MKRRLSAAVLTLVLTLGILLPGQAEYGLQAFRVRFGDPNSKKIAITMDDVNDREWVWKSVELCREYGITMTFFPNGRNILEEDADNWRDVVASGCEIGSHGYDHGSLKKIDDRFRVLWLLGKTQEQLDKVLGYHYQIRWYRPPYGVMEDPNDGDSHYKTLKKFGYDHAILWSVSQTDPEEAYIRVKNGSILLFHARKTDYDCLVVLIPRLLEAGFEPVTVSELLGVDPPEISDELYVYRKEDYK